ncbi:alpha/beta hydrolase [Cetobacterium sp.]|uniref:alpha/beta hydrolase n=1 Tax=Cetobacterium sp. TaxID=2071632 RepID=UPI003F37BB77
MKKLVEVLRKIIIFLIVIIISIQFIRAYIYNRFAPELKKWHDKSSYKEPDYRKFKTIEEYLDAEKNFLKEAFSEVEVDSVDNLTRFSKNGVLSSLDKEGNNINASFQMIPENIKGAVLLLHGLTDSPFMMKDIANVFYENGYYVLGLRYKYHGTYPGELVKISQKDFEDVAIFGSKMIKQKLKDVKNPDFYMVGFSTGAAATLQYVTSSIKKDKDLLKPKKIFWLSPAMGVSPAAKFGFLDSWVSLIPGFKKFQWLDINPEYDPAKYNSFPKNSGIQVYYLIKKAKMNFMKLSKKEKMDLPPVYSYTSLVDSTVLDKDLYDIFFKFENPSNKLVIFDINRKFEEFFKPNLINLNLREEALDLDFKFDVSFISNYKTKKDDEVEILNYRNGQFSDEKNTNLKWNESNFSLSHVSIPISPNNLIYGQKSILGDLRLKGENNSLYLSPNLLYRIRYNEFFEYIENDIKKELE